MTRIPRSHIEGALFYVTARGDHNEELFKSVEDYNTYIGLLKKYKEHYGFKLFACCLMQNHIHLLIELKEGLTISDIMHDLSANYTKYYNGRYERKGHLFQERYKLVLAEKKSYLLMLAAYIHLNPQALNSNGYLDKNFPDLDLSKERKEIDDTLLGLKNYSSYENYLLEFPKEQRDIIKNDLAKKLILGPQDFIAEVEKIAAKQNAPVENLVSKHQLRNLVLTGAAAVVILGVFSFYLYSKAEPKNTKAIKQVEDKYRSEMDTYYKDMAKTLQIERQKAKFLEEKVQGGGIRK